MTHWPLGRRWRKYCEEAELVEWQGRALERRPIGWRSQTRFLRPLEPFPRKTTCRQAATEQQTFISISWRKHLIMENDRKYSVTEQILLMLFWWHISTFVMTFSQFLTLVAAMTTLSLGAWPLALLLRGWVDAQTLKSLKGSHRTSERIQTHVKSLPFSRC